jgi:hypothetical protein
VVELFPSPPTAPACRRRVEPLALIGLARRGRRPCIAPLSAMSATLCPPSCRIHDPEALGRRGRLNLSRRVPTMSLGRGRGHPLPAAVACGRPQGPNAGPRLVPNHRPGSPSASSPVGLSLPARLGGRAVARSRTAGVELVQVTGVSLSREPRGSTPGGRAQTAFGERARALGATRLNSPRRRSRNSLVAEMPAARRSR